MPYKDIKQQREFQRPWMRERRKEYFDGKVCQNCGVSHGLELHHVDPALKFTHRIWSYCKEKREAELAKCVPLCHGCHVDNTWRRA